MGKAVRIIAQIGVLALFQLAGARLATLAGVPIPGNVVGLLLLFLALQTGLLKLTLVQEGADFLLRNLEPNFRGIIVSFLPVVHYHYRAFQTWIEGADRIPQVGGECSDTALAGKVIAEKRDLSQLGGRLRVVGKKSPAPGGILLPLADWIYLSHNIYSSNPHRKIWIREQSITRGRDFATLVFYWVFTYPVVDCSIP